MTIHCILTDVCLGKSHKEALIKATGRIHNSCLWLSFFGELPGFRVCFSQPCARTSSTKALRGFQGHVTMWTGQMCGGVTALQALARELQTRVGYLRVPNTTTWVQGCSASLAARRLGTCGRSHCGVLTLGSVLSEGLMLCTPWGKQPLL